jgi:metal-responsive CopG/Arc/MetJ family transcriptional regulator
MVILSSMKTAISLPDELFERAERVAAQLGIPRSNLYARAVEEFLDRHESEAITARLDAVYASPTQAEPAISGAHDMVFRDVEW